MIVLRGWTGSILLTAALLLTSASPVQRFTYQRIHAVGVILYVVVAGPVLALVLRYGIPWLARRAARPRVDRLIGVLVVAAFIAAFAFLYPLANSGRLGPGSDRDDALNVGLSELRAGHYPFYARTYLNAPLTCMPGALTLAAPFWALGNAAYQNIFWLVVLVVLLARAAGSTRVAAGLLLVAMCGSPELAREFVTGGDLGTNAIYVLAFVLLLAWAAQRRSARAVWCTLAAVGLGLAFSSRPNWVFLLPLALAVVADRAGRRTAVSCGTVAVGVAGLVTLPFYFYDPAGFSPLHVAQFIGYLDRYIPHVSLAIYGLTAAAAVLLALQMHRPTRTQDLALRCAVVEMVPLLLAAALAAVYEGVLTPRGTYTMSRALQLLASGHIFVYALLYAWTLANRTAWATALNNYRQEDGSLPAVTGA
jgi:hypothetical protein